MKTDILESAGARWMIAALVLVLFCITNLPWNLDDYDQSKQAFTSFEMAREGHWLYQHTPGAHIATKPPLVGWISAGLHAATRSWDLAWRLPSFGAALVLLVLLRREAGRAFGSVAGFIAAAAFGLNLLTPRLATLVRTDMPLALVTFLIGGQIWLKIRSSQPWTRADRLLAVALLTAAMLIKGPIIYAFVLPGIALFQVIRRWRKLPASACCGWWPWLVSLGIFLVWAIGGIATVPGFREQVVVREFAGRFHGEVHRAQPLFFYLPHLLHKFAPWSLLLIGLAVARWRTRGKNPERPAWSPEVIWLLGWSLGGLVAMSLIPSKRVDRIFPVIPPLCLLLAWQVEGFVRRENVRARKWIGATVLAAAVLTTGYAAQKIVTAYSAHRERLVAFGREVRREAVQKRWRLGVVGGAEEGMLLYLELPRFLEEEEAIGQWRAGTLDALVAPEDEAWRLASQLPGARVESRSPGGEKDEPERYVLLVRATGG